MDKPSKFHHQLMQQPTCNPSLRDPAAQLASSALRERYAVKEASKKAEVQFVVLQLLRRL
jgi:hypothetical protein